MAAFNTAAKPLHNKRSLYYGLRRRVVEKRAFIMAADHPTTEARAGRYDPQPAGYEISFTRYFYKPKPMRTLVEIRADILALEKETEGLLGDIIDISGGKQ